MGIKYHVETFKRKYSKQARARIVLCVIVLFGMFFISLRSVGGAIMSTIETKERLKDKNNELIQAQERNKLLKNDLKKLEDPEYISQYIRDDYHVMAEGEVFFLLPVDEVEDETTSNN